MKIFTLLISVLLVLSCMGKEQIGKIVRVEKDAYLIDAQKRVPITEGMEIKEDDTIVTGENAVVVTSFNGVQLEIQPNAVFSVRELTSSRNDFFVSVGNVWTKVDKVVKGRKVIVETPTTIAAVRGTKFYTFKMGDITGICHCEGTVDYTVKKSDYEEKHSKDYIVFTKEGKTVVLNPDELKRIGLEHHHSVLPNSPLGRQIDTPKDALEEMMRLVEEKFKALP